MGSAYNRVIETRKELTKQLLAEMEQGELPWMKGWKTTGTRPYNPVTKAVYKGNNRLRLMLASHFGQFQDNRWVTFNQAKDKGWKIKSGEKGTLCEKWIFEEKKVIEDPVTGEKETVYEELEHPKVNYFILFNADQVDGIPEKEKKEPLSRDEQLALADQFVKSSVCSVIEGANETEAYYSPARDEIHLPARDYFYSAGEFLGTAIHEMGHSTGHPSRLARDISGGFGSTSYAKEELVAELSAVFVQADLGATVQVPTLDGPVELKIPEGTQTGSKFRMKGRGIPSIRSKVRGDQYVTVNVEVPRNLNSKQKELLREFEEDKNYKQKKSFAEKMKDFLNK